MGPILVNRFKRSGPLLGIKYLWLSVTRGWLCGNDLSTHRLAEAITSGITVTAIGRWRVKASCTAPGFPVGQWNWTFSNEFSTTCAQWKRVAPSRTVRRVVVLPFVHHTKSVFFLESVTFWGRTRHHVSAAGQSQNMCTHLIGTGSGKQNSHLPKSDWLSKVVNHQ